MSTVIAQTNISRRRRFSIWSIFFYLFFFLPIYTVWANNILPCALVGLDSFLLTMGFQVSGTEPSFLQSNSSNSSTASVELLLLRKSFTLSKTKIMFGLIRRRIRFRSFIFLISYFFLLKRNEMVWQI